MNDALVGIIHVEQADTSFTALLPGRGEESLSARDQRSLATRACVDDVIGDGKDPRRIADRSSCSGQSARGG